MKIRLGENCWIQKTKLYYNFLPCRFGKSLITKNRLQFLTSLLQKQLYEKLKGNVIEIGVFRGGSMVELSLKLKELNSNKKLFGVDTFEGHPYSTQKDVCEDGKIHHQKGRYADNDYNRVKKAIIKQKCNNFILFKNEVNNIPELKKEMFCFAHVDVDTYKSTIQCINFLKKRMVKQGIIIFDDYNGKHTKGETLAVNELLGKQNIIPTGKIGCYWINK